MYTAQINKLEGQFYQKAKEIGMIQIELKTIKQFQKRKIQVEKELDDVSFFLSSLSFLSLLSFHNGKSELTTVSAEALTDLCSCETGTSSLGHVVFDSKSIEHKGLGLGAKGLHG